MTWLLLFTSLWCFIWGAGFGAFITCGHLRASSDRPEMTVPPGRIRTMTDANYRANRRCRGCGHLDATHESGRPTTILLCRGCPDGICYVWMPDGSVAGPGALPDARRLPGHGPGRLPDARILHHPGNVSIA
jgi:hypothetical protein